MKVACISRAVLCVFTSVKISADGMYRSVGTSAEDRQSEKVHYATAGEFNSSVKGICLNLPRLD